MQEWINLAAAIIDTAYRDLAKPWSKHNYLSAVRFFESEDFDFYAECADLDVHSVRKATRTLRKANADIYMSMLPEKEIPIMPESEIVNFYEKRLFSD